MEIWSVQACAYRDSSAMNGEEQGVNLSEFNPSWMEDGFGISGEQPDYVDEDLQNWDTNAWTDNGEISPEDFINGPPSCNPGNPPSTGTHIFGVVDGDCQWIDTTVCP